MNPEEMNEVFDEQQLAGAALQNAQAAGSAQSQQYYVQEQERGIAEAQLECETTLNKLYHQLCQDSLEPKDDDKSVMDWRKIKDIKKQRLTEDGVKRIIEVMSFYINKENLLSNFSEEQIREIMLTFRLAFSANILMRYKIYFRQPSRDECQQIFEARIGDKVKARLFSRKMAGLDTNEAEVKQEFLLEFENRIEQEIEKIREEKKKEMLSEFELLFEQLSQLVFATLNRAWKGEERGSLRRHTNISEVIGGRPQANAQQGGGNFYRWGKD